MTTFLTDNFTHANGTLLENHTADSGATWTKHPSYAQAAKIQANRVYADGAATSLYYASVIPPADCNIEALIVKLSGAGAGGIAGRLDPAADTYYLLSMAGGSSDWSLTKVVAGVPTTLATYDDTVGTGGSRTARLQLRGTSIKGFIDGVERLSATDGAITAAGRVGVYGFNGTATGRVHVDSLVASDAWSQAIGDTAGLADAPAKAASAHPADAVGLIGSDAAAATLTAPLDSVAVTDAISNRATLAMAETASLLDGVQDAIALARTDAAPVADGRDLTATFTRNADDAEGLSDLLAHAASLVLDGDVAASDDLLRAASLQFAEILALADGAATQAGFASPLADAVGLGDAVQDALTLTLVELVGLDDESTIDWTAIRALADETALGDASARQPDLGLGDALPVADSRSLAAGWVRVLADFPPLDDGTSTGPGIGLANGAALADAALNALAIALADALPTADANLRGFIIARTVAEILALADQADIDLDRLLTYKGGQTGQPSGGSSGRPGGGRSGSPAGAKLSS